MVERDRLQLGESLATGSVAEEDWELVADDFAAALGEDRRTAVKHARKQCGGIQEIWRRLSRLEYSRPSPWCNGPGFRRRRCSSPASPNLSFWSSSSPLNRASTPVAIVEPGHGSSMRITLMLGEFTETVNRLQSTSS